MNRPTILVLLAALQTAMAGPALLPVPQKVVPRQGTYALTPETRVLYQTRRVDRAIECTLAPLAQAFSGELELVTGHRPLVLAANARNRPKPGDILLRFSELQAPFAETETDEEHSYRLDVSPRGVLIDAAYFKGVAHGTVTFLQSLVEEDGRFSVPAMEIHDAPAEAYRSVMIDVARKPHSIDVLKDVIRLARMSKLRYLQLHLTDNESFTFPFDPVVSKLENNNHYTRAELVDLVAYADARGITLIPELDLPGHSSKLRASGYLDPGKNDADVADPANAPRINALIDDILTVFRSSPYFHIGGDESGAGSKLVPFLKSVNTHLRGNPAGGKRRMIVWEGFHGSPTADLPAKGEDRIIVMAWESSYNAPWDLLESGYEIINASWKPLYLAGGGGFAHPGSTGGRKFRLTDLHRWNKSIFMHWEPGRPIYEDRGPKDPDREDREWDARWIGQDHRILGAQMEFWEQNESSVLIRLPARLAIMAERLWNPDLDESFDAFAARAKVAAERTMTIVQPVRILPPDLPESLPITDFYQPYSGDSLDVMLQNRTRIAGTIRYTEGSFSNNYGWIGFSPAGMPTRESPAADGPVTKAGGFSICARLFREDGTPVEGTTWKFFNNWPNRVRVTDFQIGPRTPKEVIDLAALPEDRIMRRFDMPMVRGPVQHIEIKGQMHLSQLTVPQGGEVEIGIRTQNGRATLYLDLNRDGRWEASEAIVRNSPPSVEPRTAKVRLKAGEAYPLRIDHMTGMPRPVLSLFIVSPDSGKRQDITEYLSLPGS